MLVEELDAVVDKTISCYRRMTGIPPRQMSMSDLHFMDGAMATELEDRLVHILESAPEKVPFIQSVASGSAHTKMVAPFLAYLVKYNEPPEHIAVSLPSDKEMKTTYKGLSAWLLTNMAADSYSLVGFKTSGNQNVWFSSLSESSTSFVCTDHVGGRKKVPFVALEELGYSRIDGSQKGLKALCKKDLSTMDPKEVKLVGFYLGKQTLKTERRHDAAKMLEETLQSIAPNAQKVDVTRKETVKI